MIKKSEIDKLINKPTSDYTDDDYKKLSRWYLMKNILALTIFFTAIALGIIAAFLTPSTWRWFLKIPFGVATSGAVLWLVAIIRDNIQYNDRKKKQARKKQIQASNQVSPTKQIHFNKEKYEALKIAYAQAVADKKKSFLSEGGEFVTIQAEVMLELLKPIYERTPNQN